MVGSADEYTCTLCICEPEARPISLNASVTCFLEFVNRKRCGGQRSSSRALALPTSCFCLQADRCEPAQKRNQKLVEEFECDLQRRELDRCAFIFPRSSVEFSTLGSLSKMIQQWKRGPVDSWESDFLLLLNVFRTFITDE